MHSSSNPTAIVEDSNFLFKNDFVDRTLSGLRQEVLMLRAERGLQNEAIPLYPLEVLNAVLARYPKVKLVTVSDTNHYDILLEQGGADKCAELIYGFGSVNS